MRLGHNLTSFNSCRYGIVIVLLFGGDSGGVTPVPIPNTEVKLSSADGTTWVTVWESRSPPGFSDPSSKAFEEGFFFGVAD